jgi:orotidine-5'-phosphate decarboxylase
MNLFGLKHGIILACDVRHMNGLEKLIEMTCDVEGIVGYKIGSILGLKYGLPLCVDAIRKRTDLPIIYDHQKLGTDIPDICADFLVVCKDAGINAVIIFPQSGPETLRAAVRGCFDLGLTPIVGGEMTHSKYLLNEGGYIGDDAPERMYMDAAKLGVDYFVSPGAKIDKMKGYRLLIEGVVKDPRFLFPGVGKEYQGGDMIAAFEAVRPHASYAIVGRAIYSARDAGQKAKSLYQEYLLRKECKNSI